VEHEERGSRERELSFSEVTWPWHITPLPGADRGHKRQRHMKEEKKKYNRKKGKVVKTEG
jgi:hypothetical protein